MEVTRTLIKVTKDDIAVGRPGISAYCPVAYAIRRQVPGYLGTELQLYVSPISIWIYTRQYHVPRTAERFMLAFDKGQQPTPKPFNFWLREV